jgi:hypothetical protein
MTPNIEPPDSAFQISTRNFDELPQPVAVQRS